MGVCDIQRAAPGRVARALARHAPNVPVADLDPSETRDMADLNVMGVVVKSSAELAQPGDVVLLGAAALPTAMAATYGARGGAFEVPVRRGPDDQRGR